MSHIGLSQQRSETSYSAANENNPKIIKRMNKALGIPKKSKALWDILQIQTNTDNIANLEMRVDGLESFYSKSFLHFLTIDKSILHCNWFRFF